MSRCLAGSSKTVPKILIFSIAMGADYSFELNSIETYAPQFFGHNNLFLGSVHVGIRLTCPQPTRLCYAFSAAKTVVFKITKIIHNPRASIIRGDCNWLFFTKNLMLLPFFRISQVSCKQKPFI